MHEQSIEGVFFEKELNKLLSVLFTAERWLDVEQRIFRRINQ
jgi:hypothetical protein